MVSVAMPVLLVKSATTVPALYPANKDLIIAEVTVLSWILTAHTAASVRQSALPAKYAQGDTVNSPVRKD